MTGNQPHFCAVQSRQANEHLFGTAPRVDVWLLLEYAGRWEPDALEESALPDAVKNRLLDWRDSIPNTRFAFIRREERHTPDEALNRFAFYVALVCDQHPALYAFRLDDYPDLLSLDVPAICAGEAVPDRLRVAHPVYLVCTHGRRDACCARYGRPIYEALAGRTGATVWQSSHVGGHRLAANVIALPDGLCYGRVEPEEAAALIEAHEARRLALDNLRGRSCYDKPVQAAEYYLRNATGIRELDAFTLAAAHQQNGTWTVQFTARADGATHTVRLAAEPSGLHTYLNCDDDEPATLTQYRLVEHARNGAHTP